MWYGQDFPSNLRAPGPHARAGEGPNALPHSYGPSGIQTQALQIAGICWFPILHMMIGGSNVELAPTRTLAPLEDDKLVLVCYMNMYIIFA